MGPKVRWWWPVLADVVCVLALAASGKRSHEAGDPAWVVLAIAWPFAVAVMVSHLVLLGRGSRTAERTWPEGAFILAATYVIGMALRAASGRGMAPAFLLVAGLFLTATMLGWRLAWRVVADRASRRDGAGSG